MSEKRSRGRPVGSGGKNDTKYLHQVADILLAHPKLKPTTAMRQVLNKQVDAIDANSDAAMLRRLQHKWKRDAAGYVEASKARAKMAYNQHVASDVMRLVTQYESFMQRVAASEDIQRMLLSINAMAVKAADALAGPMAQIQSYVERNPEVLMAITRMAANTESLAKISNKPLMLPHSFR